MCKETYYLCEKRPSAYVKRELLHVYTVRLHFRSRKVKAHRERLVSKCYHCDSTEHLVARCPHKQALTHKPEVAAAVDLRETQHI